ncbi:MAG: coproporphyrinogen III oxidase family protein [bacterium]|nr:coproporphyrinogen III oxidase family protein [bacterium]
MTQPEAATSGRLTEEQELGSVFVSNYPPYSAWSEDAVAEARRALDEPPIEGRDLGLYLHIPFCRKRCKFCYFRVYTDKNFDEIGSYLDALCREVEMYSERPAIANRRPRFVYFGGGTPSYISAKHLRALVERLQRAIPWDGVEEVAFECEPGTLTAAKLEAIREIGVTRLSLGIENFDDDILRLNGRAHVSHEINRCMPWIRDLDFEQLNVDLIAGMLGETWTKWKQTVARTIEVGADSVTIYQLELPFNTRFTKNILDGELEVPVADWDLKREWHAYAIEEFSKAGYETSSAYTLVRKSGEENRARFLYRDSVWNGCDLLGTGVASFSHVSDVHFQNCDGWGEYLARIGDGELPLNRAFATRPDERLTREFILQLKLGRLEAQAFSKKFGVDVLERFSEPLGRLEKEGWLEVSGGAVKLSGAGLLRVDSLLPDFYEDSYRNARYT